MKEWLSSNVTWIDLMVITAIYIVGRWASKLYRYLQARRYDRMLSDMDTDREYIKKILRKM